VRALPGVLLDGVHESTGHAVATGGRVDSVRRGGRPYKAQSGIP
jgi:hypothetical protein